MIVVPDGPRTPARIASDAGETMRMLKLLVASRLLPAPVSSAVLPGPPSSARAEEIGGACSRLAAARGLRAMSGLVSARVRAMEELVPRLSEWLRLWAAAAA